jgi:hypothetical protein
MGDYGCETEQSDGNWGTIYHIPIPAVVMKRGIETVEHEYEHEYEPGRPGVGIPRHAKDGTSRERTRDGLERTYSLRPASYS